MVTQLLACKWLVFLFSKTELDAMSVRDSGELEIILLIAACHLIKFWALLKEMQVSQIALELWCSG